MFRVARGQEASNTFMKLQSSSVLFVCCALASTGLVLGCYATAGAGTAAPPPEPVVVQTEDNVVYEAPPPQIETYPVVVYDNRPHYYYEGRWYHRS